MTSVGARTLRTERLLLRQWRYTDRDPFAEMGRDPEVMRHFPAVLSREASDALVSRASAHLDEHGWGLWAVEVADDSALAGRFVGFTGLVRQEFPAHFTPAVEIGWRLAREAWGHGYATEAARTVLAFAFDELDLPEVVSMTAVGNTPSRAVMERIGLHRDPLDDFDHPRVPEGSPLRRHVLYRVGARERARGGRAVVLGGGGVAGIAWESALVTTLLERGVDLSDADVVVGTSAGSVVGTALRSGGITEWFDRQLAAPGTAPDHPVEMDLEPLMAAVAAAGTSRDGESATRARLGRFALDAAPGTHAEASVAGIRSLLPLTVWPERELRITVVDAESGEFRVVTSRDGVDLATAVTASCAVPSVYPTVEIDGRRYMDGGMRSGTNADVAADCERVLVIACGPEGASSPLGPTLTQSVAALRKRADVLVIEADADSLRAFGANSLLLGTRFDSATAGRRQADAVAERVRAFWV